MQTNTSQQQNEHVELKTLTEDEQRLVSGGTGESVQATDIPTWPPVIQPS